VNTLTEEFGPINTHN